MSNPDESDFDAWLAEHSPWRWLRSTRRLQDEVYGFNFDALTGDALADYVTWNVVALQEELHEFLGEVEWKTWAKDRGAISNRAAAVEELVDVAHFLANLATALDVTDEEWELAYRRKQLKNASRQRTPGGYGRDLKCPTCRRALDAPGGIYRRASGIPQGLNVQAVFCSGCDTMIAENVYAVLRENGVVDGE